MVGFVHCFFTVIRLRQREGVKLCVSEPYFIRKSYGSRRWIIFLDGGWYCFDKRSCEARWTRLRNLMTSSTWPSAKQVGGMLSPDPEENPYWWNANHVYIPYCSSDSWSGTAAQGSGTRFAFMGAIILQEVLRDLQLQGMSNASKIFLTGSSAGGIGILLNLDKAVELLRSWGSKADIRGVSDSGWFLDHAPFAPVDCVDPQRCSPSTAVQLGYKLWQAQLPEACVKDHASQPWKCYFGHHIHRTMKTPLFVFQWLFDEAQITAGNVGPPITKQQWDYIHKVGDQLRQSLENVSAVFAPSCISHTVLTNRDWQNFRVGSVGLPQALRCWELRSPSHTSDEQGYFGQGPHIRHNHKLKNKETNHVTTVLLSDEPGSTAISRPARKLVKSGSTNQQRNNASSADRVAVSLSEKEHNSSSVGRGDRKKQKDNSRRKNRPRTKGGNKKVADAGEEAVRKRAASDKVKVPKAKRGHGKGNKKNKTASERARRSVDAVCQSRAIDHCSWPQCNRGCPKLHNPLTGEEMDFIQLLKSFGLDMSSVANALGIDLHTLTNMDHDLLLHLLTQQAT
nr:EOG090X02ZJ [Triops cancriformis]